MERPRRPEAKSTETAKLLHDRCCSHDSHTRNAAFQELGEFLLRVAYSRLRAHMDLVDLAEECTQQALVIIWQKLKEQRGPDHVEWFMSWAAGIVIHKVLDELRRIGRSRTTPLDVASLDVDTAGAEFADVQTPAPEQQALTTEVNRELLRLIRDHPRLTPEAKYVLLGGYLQEQNDGELATQLNKATVTIRVIRSRGLKILREDRHFMAELKALATPMSLSR